MRTKQQPVKTVNEPYTVRTLARNETCRIKLPIPIKLVSELAAFYKGENVRMKEEYGYLVFFEVGKDEEVQSEN